MQSGAPHEPATGRQKVLAREEAAHEKRNWVRLTFDCNDRCVFCLDSDAHDGRIRDRAEVRAQILEGRRKGAERLILSGGEPTIHPNFVDFIRLGRLAGYRWIQTVTNGRMFRYEEFLRRCIEAGLDEVTFSVHGPNARVHDALVGVRGAFDEEMAGLRAAVRSGRLVVNADICVNRGNVRLLAETIEMLYREGIREFDLLQIVPFGRAWSEGRAHLFYDLAEMRPHLVRAFAWSRRPDVQIWLNRFPPEHCEGFEHLIQDPYKLHDEIRGRREEFERLLEDGTPLDCRTPERCARCYLQRLCDGLDALRTRVREGTFEEARLDVTWEARQPPIFGGDPASARKLDGRARLPLWRAAESEPVLDPPSLLRRAGCRRLHVIAPDLPAALEAVRPFDSVDELCLQLDDWSGLPQRIEEGPCDALAGRRLRAVVATGPEQAAALHGRTGCFELVVHVTRSTVPWILSHAEREPRLVLRLPTFERLSEADAALPDLQALFTAIPATIPVEDVPRCILGRPPRPRPPRLDLGALRPDGRIEIFRYGRRFVQDEYYVRSMGCAQCVESPRCRGLHVNHVRARGFSAMRPVRDAAAAATEEAVARADWPVPRTAAGARG
ncbi:MAG: radical SAM protein [Myxococcales bacterium]|nr:radical SAM protein [Myxococcales bacterium]